jgi:glycosyltransferase involved in cell wall biosynthesis
VHSSGIVRSLARLGHRVSVYSLAGRQGDYSVSGLFRASYHLEQIEPGLQEETNLGLGYGLLQTGARRLDRPRAWQYWLLSRGLVPRRLKRALADSDIVLSDMPWVPRIPGPWQTKPWFLISHNLEYRLLEQAHGKHRDYAAWMERIETAAPSRYTDIFPCAESDLAFYRAHDAAGRLRLPLIGCGVDPEAYRVPAGTRERIRAELGLGERDRLIVFSGSRYAPNVEALETLRTFCRAERSYLEAAGIHFLALGSMAAEASHEGALITTGRVPEVTPYFAAADAGLNPITRGSGANVKLFEYLATRLPVISTAFGVRGTELLPDRDYLMYEPGNLRDALQRFIASHGAAEWRDYAEDVWQRHRKTCDIQEIVADAVALRPEFAD